MQSTKKRSSKPKGPKKKHTKSLLGRVEEAQRVRESEVAAGEYHKALDKAQREYWSALTGLSGKGGEGRSRMSHSVLPQHDGDLILTDGADVRYSYNRIQNNGWFRGQVSGVRRGIDFIRSQAVEMFRDRNPSLASQLQTIADEMQKTLLSSSRDLVVANEEAYPEVIEKQ